MNNRKLAVLFLVIIISIGGIAITYELESNETMKGKTEFILSYRYRLTNEGPLNLTSLSLRLALLKDWDPVQQVNSLAIKTAPNLTTTDEYGNEFAWYEYDSFSVNQSIDLQFDVNLTLYQLDYSAAHLTKMPYITSTELYKLYTAYHPLTDTTDPGIQQVAQRLGVVGDPQMTAYNAYNFSSSYIRYRLSSSIKGASYALRNAHGDCDEYTSLFIALVRANGIPAAEHTAWLADFTPGFETTDEGAVAHAYPMFYLEGEGWLPVDPTRGNKNLYDNWLKTDQKRITLTRGPDHPYRLLKYRWIPVEGVSEPAITSNYTVKIQDMKTEYYSVLRPVIIAGLTGGPFIFIALTVIEGLKFQKQQKMKLDALLSPEK
ncbi:MAG: transglutaminase family protein [Candidatus Odinarchaeota archaeon]